MSREFRLTFDARPFLDDFARLSPDLMPARARDRVADLSRDQRLALFEECRAVFYLESYRGQPLDTAADALSDALIDAFHADAVRLGLLTGAATSRAA